MSMQLTYTPTDTSSVSTAYALHDYGDLQIIGERREVDDRDNPQEFAVTLTVKIISTEDTYNENRERMQAIHTALSIPKGTLTWADSETGTTYLSARPVTAVSSDLPEDPNAIGTWRQEITVTFSWRESVKESQDTLKITFLRTGSTTPIELGYVTKWQEGMRNSRFSDMVSTRSSCIGNVVASGSLRADTSHTLTVKRAALQAELAALMKDLNGKTGILLYGWAGQFFNRTVKLDDFTADVDQAEDKIDWTLSATFTRFPDETGYAVAEYSASTTTNYETGEETLSFSGRIGAPSKEIAAAKLSALDTAVKSTYGFSSARQTRASIDYRNVSVSPPSSITLKGTSSATIDDLPNADNSSATDASFIELSFTYDYTKRSTNILTWTLKVSSQEDTRTGLNTVSYSGTVVAGGATSASAYTSAVAKVTELASAKHQMQVAKSISAEYKKQESPNEQPEELVQLDFNYTYLTKTDRYYFELTEDSSFEAAGEAVTSYSGFVVESTKAAAESKYKTYILALFNGSKLRNERVSWTKSCIEEVTHSGTNKSPDVDLSGSTEIQMSSKYHTQDGVYNFSFQIARTRLDGETAMRYSITTSFDYVALEKTIRVSGIVTAGTLTTAAAYLAGFVRPGSFSGTDVQPAKQTSGTNNGKYLFGSTVVGDNLTSWELQESSEYLPSISVSSTVKSIKNSGSNTFGSLSFNGSYTSPITGEEGIIEAEMSEDIKAVGIRYVNQDIVGSYVASDGSTCSSVIQNTGEEAGSRTVTGTVTAATETIAMAWAKKCYAFPFMTGSYVTSAQVTRYRGPIQLSTSWRWLPRTSEPGVYDATMRQWVCNSSNMANNAKFCQIRFSFTELLNSFRLKLDEQSVS